MENPQDIIKAYVDNLLKSKDDILQDLFDEIYSSNRPEEPMREYKLLTVISEKDNPNIEFNTTVRQPNYHITENSGLGTGIMCYKENALNILKRTITREQRIVKISIEIQESEILCLTRYSKQKEMLKAFYNNLTHEEKEHINSDETFINYVCKKSNPKYKAVMGITVLGNKIYPESNIIEYMDTAISLKTEDIITRAELAQ